MRGSLGIALGVALLALSTVYGQAPPAVYTAEIDGIRQAVRCECGSKTDLLRFIRESFLGAQQFL